VVGECTWAFSTLVKAETCHCGSGNLPSTISQGVRTSTIIWVMPLFFGVGHFHHVYFLVKQGWTVAQALQPVRLCASRDVSCQTVIQTALGACGRQERGESTGFTCRECWHQSFNYTCF
jgi:hypothetical protein